jgi:uncharacterized protein (TIGR03000 family)
MNLGSNHWPVWILAIGLVTLGANAAQAQYSSYGSWGSSGGFGSYGSNGSWGSSGGSSGYYGSSGGSSGYYGSFGSSGGSHGSSGSSGGWWCCGSSGSWGSSGGSDRSYVYPHHSWPAPPITRRESRDDENAATRVVRRYDTDYQNDLRQSSEEAQKTPALVELSVPEDSVVHLGGQQMTLTGRRRIYFSQPLSPGKTYAYTVEVEATRNGRVVKGSISQPILAGGAVRLEAIFQDANRSLSLREIADTSGSASLQVHNSRDGAAAKVAGHSE